MPRTALKRAARDLHGYAKDARTLALRRPTPEIVAAMRARLSGARAALERAEKALEELEQGGERQ